MQDFLPISANMLEVDAREISPEVAYAYPKPNCNSTIQGPIIEAAVAAYLLVSFHKIASEIGATAEPIKTPIAKINVL